MACFSGTTWIRILDSGCHARVTQQPQLWSLWYVGEGVDRVVTGLVSHSQRAFSPGNWIHKDTWEKAALRKERQTPFTASNYLTEIQRHPSSPWEIKMSPFGHWSNMTIGFYLSWETIHFQTKASCFGGALCHVTLYSFSQMGGCISHSLAMHLVMRLCFRNRMK